MRIPAPGEAHRFEIRAVAPPWHRGGCDHNQLSTERVLTVGCTCAPPNGGETTKQIKTPVCARAATRQGWMQVLVLMVSGGNLIAASSSSTLSLSLCVVILPQLRADAESHDAFRVLAKPWSCFKVEVGNNKETGLEASGLFLDMICKIQLNAATCWVGEKHSVCCLLEASPAEAV